MEDHMTKARARIRMSVQSKLLGSFGLVVALMLGLGLFAVTRLGSENQRLGTLASKVVPSTRALGEINLLVEKYRKDQMSYILAKPAERLPDLGVDAALIYGHLGPSRAQGLIQNTAERRLLDSFQVAFARYVVLTAPFQALADQGRISQASELVVSGPGDAEHDKMKVAIAGWSDQQVKSARAAETTSQSAYRKSLVLILALLGLAVAIAVAVALVLARRT